MYVQIFQKITKYEMQVSAGMKCRYLQVSASIMSVSARICWYHTFIYCHIHTYIKSYIHIRTDVFARIWYVFDVRICSYLCQYLHVLHVYVRIKGTKNCQSHRYVQIRAVRTSTAVYEHDTYKILTRYEQNTCKYIPNTYT